MLSVNRYCKILDAQINDIELGEWVEVHTVTLKFICSVIHLKHRLVASVFYHIVRQVKSLIKTLDQFLFQ